MTNLQFIYELAKAETGGWGYSDFAEAIQEELLEQEERKALTDGDTIVRLDDFISISTVEVIIEAAKTVATR